MHRTTGIDSTILLLLYEVEYRVRLLCLLYMRMLLAPVTLLLPLPSHMRKGVAPGGVSATAAGKTQQEAPPVSPRKLTRRPELKTRGGQVCAMCCALYYSLLRGRRV